MDKESKRQNPNGYNMNKKPDTMKTISTPLKILTNYPNQETFQRNLLLTIGTLITTSMLRIRD